MNYKFNIGDRVTVQGSNDELDGYSGTVEDRRNVQIWQMYVGPIATNAYNVKLDIFGASITRAIHESCLVLAEAVTKPEEVCKCDIWVNGCKCGVFQREMEKKRGQKTPSTDRDYY